LGCVDFKVNENSVTVVIRNGKGQDITVSGIKVSDCTGIDIGFLRNGAVDTYIIDGCNHTQKEKFNGDLYVTYTTQSGLISKITGSVVDRVQRGTSQSPTLLVDDFNRADNSTVGNSWFEDEGNMAKARILDNRLDFTSNDKENIPLISKTFTKQTSGNITWAYIFNFDRREYEKTYQVLMQLGDSAVMLDPPSNNGIAVNLKWGGPNTGMTNHEGFGYVNGGSTTETAIVSGVAGDNAGGDVVIVVNVNLDSNTYDYSIYGVGLISGSGATNVPFDNDVDIDKVRIYLDRLNQNFFEDLEIDDISILST
ncbi:hypothetical protein KY312_01790, partial [Candidatus Woesearchaeota archaeon]|nr:hypothetical protein [Candidatus Woesearchaeota archaeon]